MGWVKHVGFGCLNLEVTRVIFTHSPLVETICMVPLHLESFPGGLAVNTPPAMQETPV